MYLRDKTCGDCFVRDDEFVCDFGGGPRSVGDMLSVRTSRFLAVPEKKRRKKLISNTNY